MPLRRCYTGDGVTDWVSFLMSKLIEEISPNSEAVIASLFVIRNKSIPLQINFS